MDDLLKMRHNKIINIGAIRDTNIYLYLNSSLIVTYNNIAIHVPIKAVMIKFFFINIVCDVMCNISAVKKNRYSVN